MYRVAVVEDDAQQRALLNQMLERFPRRDEFVATQLASVYELEKYVLGGAR